MSPQHVVIEFQDKYCQVFAAQSGKGAYVLKGRAIVPLQKPSEEVDAEHAAQANGEALKKALKSIGASTNEALALVPKQWVTLRVVSLPSNEESELVEMARFEAERHIPFNVERHVISHHVIDLKSLEGARVLIAALDAPPADEVTAIADAAGIHLNALEVSTVAQINALRAAGAWDNEASPTVALVDIGLSTTDITVLHNGEPIFARSIAVGVERILPDETPSPEEALEKLHADGGLEVPEGIFNPEPPAPAGPASGEGGPSFSPDDSLSPESNLGPDGDLAPPSPPPASTAPEGSSTAPGRAETDAEKFRSWSRRLIQEIRRTHDFARREFECEGLTQLFVSGQGAGLGNIESLLEESLGIRPVVLNPIGDKVQVDPSSDSLKLPPPAFATVAGALLRDEGPPFARINLLPPAYLAAHARSRRRRSMIFTAVLAILAIGAAIGWAAQIMANGERELGFYRERIREGRDRAKEIRYRQTVVRILKENTSEEGSALAILNTISQWNDFFEPPTMRVALVNFTYELGSRRPMVQLEGEAREHEDLNDFVTRLRESGHFEEVEIVSRPTKEARNVRGIQIIEFQVNCYLPERKTAESSEEEE